MPTAIQHGSSLEFFVPVPALRSVTVRKLEPSFVYVLINEDGQNRERVVQQRCYVVQYLNEALMRGYLMRSQQQWFPSRILHWISHDPKRRSNARYSSLSVSTQAQICHYPTEAPFHSDQRCSHIADAADEHSYGWLFAEVAQSARNLNDTKRSTALCNFGTVPGLLIVFHTAECRNCRSRRKPAGSPSNAMFQASLSRTVVS